LGGKFKKRRTRNRAHSCEAGIPETFGGTQRDRIQMEVSAMCVVFGG